VDIRRLTPEDTDAVLGLCAAAGWNQTAADVRRLMALEPAGCFAAQVRDRVVGTATTTSYGSALAWVGMVLVHPAFRRRGVASALMDVALEYLRRRGVITVKLDATAAGRPVYERLGFVAEGRLERWSGQATPPGGAMSGGTWAEVAGIDRSAFGADRGQMLQSIVADTPYPMCVQRDGSGRPTGYALVRPGSRAGYVGPLIAGDLETAGGLLSAALARIATGPVFIDVNTDFPGATDLLGRLGFTRQRELLCMRIGPDGAVGRSPRVFAIAGPEVG
jgi:GNAT superfamily N-acetyltransferase